ncbi:MAG TPA: hypothetical protein VFZ76_13260 [Anaerolineales bacterium]
MATQAKAMINGPGIPVRRDLKLAYALSLVIALLMAGVSLAGLFYQSRLYPNDELRRAFVPNDLVNLLIGLPVLLGSVQLARRGVLAGLLLWPGGLLYVLYNYIAYIFGTPFSLISFAYVALVLLSAYILLNLVQSIDRKSVRERLLGAVPEKIGGWILIILGVVFLFRAVGMIAQATTSGTMLPIAQFGTLVADLVLSVVWIVGGAWLLQRMPLGYASGLGLLFSGSMLFIALIIFLLLQPVLTDAPFLLTDVIVVFIMGLICFIPFALFTRGVISKS